MMQAGMYWMESPKFGVAVSQNGKDYFYLEGAITHQYVDGQPVPMATPVTRTIQLYASTPKGKEVTFAKLAKMGWNGDVYAPAFAWTGKEDGLEVECRIESYEGKNVERWDTPAPGGGYEHKAADDAKKRELMSQYCAATGKPAAATPPPSRGPVPVSPPMRQREPGDEGDGDLAF